MFDEYETEIPYGYEAALEAYLDYCEDVAELNEIYGTLAD